MVHCLKNRFDLELKLIQEISDSPMTHIVQSRFADNIIKILKEKL